jgi:hypothetical protein
VSRAETILNLTPILTNAGLCPKQAAADAHAFQLLQQGKLSPRAAHGSTAGKPAVPFLPKLPVN